MKSPGYGWASAPLRISLRLAARLLCKPLKGGVIVEPPEGAWSSSPPQNAPSRPPSRAFLARGAFEGSYPGGVVGVVGDRQCVPERVHLNRRRRGFGSAGFTRPRAHASVSEGTLLSLPNAASQDPSGLSSEAKCGRGYAAFFRRPVGNLSVAGLRQPRLRRSPLSHNTGAG